MTDDVTRERHATQRQDLVEDGRASFIVLKVRAKDAPQTRPLLVIATKSGDIAVPREPAAWAKHLSQSHSRLSPYPAMATIGRLYEYTSLAFADVELTSEMLPTVLWNYTAFRVGERSTDDPDVEMLPFWQPVRIATAINEFNTIISYLRFCNRSFGTIPMLPRPDPSLSRVLDTFQLQRSSEKRDFFEHLRAHRERWRTLIGPDRIPIPHVKPSGNLLTKRSAAGQTMPLDEVRLVIDAEENVMFKTLWILLAFGGVRVSEALNLWCADVMPGSMLQHFESGSTQKKPLVILTDPIKSSYVGDLASTSVTRQDYLKKRYGLDPRPLYPNKHTMRAGWKSMLFTSRHFNGVSWIYWCLPAAGADFLQLAATLLRHRRALARADLHPYFFFNLKNRDYAGDPLRYSNASKAFERACLRVQLEPHERGRSIHGLRHFYTGVLKHTLKLKDEIIQVMLHHKSLLSQEDYARAQSNNVNLALKQAFAEVGHNDN